MVRKQNHYSVQDAVSYKQHLLDWSRSFQPVCVLDSNGFMAQNQLYSDQRENHDFIAGIGSIAELLPIQDRSSFDRLAQFIEAHKDWIMGYFSYDLKNELEDLKSEKEDKVNAPLLHFFVPRYLIQLSGNELVVHYLESLDQSSDIDQLKHSIEKAVYHENHSSSDVEIQARISREDYIQSIQKIKEHIQRGDIYEINFCQEFFAQNCLKDPVALYRRLNDQSPSPFSVYYHQGSVHLLSASPERYLKKEGNKIIAQPIKGTARRGQNEKEDQKLRDELVENEKERSENIMIVDLVRNDLSRVAARATVKVKELCGVYSFPQVHQLISTVEAELSPNASLIDAIKASFPMGSMTGAPKIRAMELIEQFETRKRGMYSGAVGYIDPQGNADFNVVIRSMIYNEKNHYLSFMVGGAITSKSQANAEYEECLLKASAMMSVLGVEKIPD